MYTRHLQHWGDSSCSCWQLPRWRHGEVGGERKHEGVWACPLFLRLITIRHTDNNSASDVPSCVSAAVRGRAGCQRLCCGATSSLGGRGVNEEDRWPTGSGPLIPGLPPPPGWRPAACRQRWPREKPVGKARFGTWRWSARTSSRSAGQWITNVFIVDLLACIICEWR